MAQVHGGRGAPLTGIPLAGLQAAQEEITSQLRGLVQGSVAPEQFANATSSANLLAAIGSTALPDPELADPSDPEWPWPPSSPGNGESSDSALAIGLGVGLGVGLPAAMAAAALGLWWRGRRQRRGAQRMPA